MNLINFESLSQKIEPFPEVTGAAGLPHLDVVRWWRRKSASSAAWGEESGEKAVQKTYHSSVSHTAEVEVQRRECSPRIAGGAGT